MNVFMGQPNADNHPLRFSSQEIAGCIKLTKPTNQQNHQLEKFIFRIPFSISTLAHQS